MEPSLESEFMSGDPGSAAPYASAFLRLDEPERAGEPVAEPDRASPDLVQALRLARAL